jgi:hypothetical protein
LVYLKAAFPIVATVGRITSVPSRLVSEKSEKALSPISTVHERDRVRQVEARELGVQEGL